MREILTPHEWYAVNNFLKELATTPSPVVSVYTPRSEATSMIQTLRETERDPGTEEVEAVIEKRLASHKGGTLCTFGWNTEKGVEIKELTVSTVLPPVYVVDEKPYTEPLHDILEINYDVLLLILDHTEARFQHFKGKDISEQSRIKAYIRGKHRKGGWSQKRFERIRKIQIRNFFQRVEASVRECNLKQIDLILLAGPGKAKNEFQQFLPARKKISILEGVTFTTSPDMITEKVIASLDRFRKNLEYQQLRKVEDNMKKGLTEKENTMISQTLQRGAVDTLLIASDYFVNTPQEKKQIMQMIELAEKTSAEVEFITNQEVLKELHKYGSVVATLRYRV